MGRARVLIAFLCPILASWPISRPGAKAQAERWRSSSATSSDPCHQTRSHPPGRSSMAGRATPTPPAHIGFGRHGRKVCVEARRPASRLARTGHHVHDTNAQTPPMTAASFSRWRATCRCCGVDRRRVGGLRVLTTPGGSANSGSGRHPHRTSTTHRDTAALHQVWLISTRPRTRLETGRARTAPDLATPVQHHVSQQNEGRTHEDA